MLKVTQSIFDDIRKSITCHAQILDICQIMIDLFNDGASKKSLKYLNDFTNQAKQDGTYSLRDGVCIYQGVCRSMIPQEDGGYVIKNTRLHINLTKGQMPDSKVTTFSFYIVLVDIETGDRLIHFSIDFTGANISLFCISEGNTVLNKEFLRLDKMFPENTLNEPGNMEICINHFLLNILYKYMIASTNETTYTNEEFNAMFQ